MMSGTTRGTSVPAPGGHYIGRVPAFLSFALRRFGRGLVLLVALSACVGANAEDEARKGLDGWLILTGPDGNVEDYLRATTVPANRLALLTGRVKAIEAVLGKRSTFVWVVAPNTPTIYPESMPARFKRKGMKSRVEQIGAAFSSSGSAAFLDLAPALAAAKSMDGPRLYKKTDSHWTDIGAYVGYREIMRYLAQLRPDLAKQLAPASLDDYVQSTISGHSGDLAVMMGLKGELTEDLPILTPKSERGRAIALNVAYAIGGLDGFERRPAPQMWIDRLGPGIVTVDNRTRCPGPTLLVFHDSYMVQLAGFLVENFCKSTFRFGSWHPEAIKLGPDELAKDSPTFVLLETSERLALTPFVGSTLDELGKALPIPDANPSKR